MKVTNNKYRLFIIIIALTVLLYPSFSFGHDDVRITHTVLEGPDAELEIVGRDHQMAAAGHLYWININRTGVWAIPGSTLVIDALVTVKMVLNERKHHCAPGYVIPCSPPTDSEDRVAGGQIKINLIQTNGDLIASSFQGGVGQGLYSFTVLHQQSTDPHSLGWFEPWVRPGRMPDLGPSPPANRETLNFNHAAQIPLRLVVENLPYPVTGSYGPCPNGSYAIKLDILNQFGEVWVVPNWITVTHYLPEPMSDLLRKCVTETH